MANIDPNRRDPITAKAVLDYLYPTEGIRYFVNNLLATAIVSAHRADPNKWSITLFYKRDIRIRVNVGMLEVLILNPDFVYLVLHEKDFSLDDLMEFNGVTEAHAYPPDGLYKNAPGSISCWSIAADLPDYFHLMEPSWKSIIKIASGSQRQPATNRATHSSGVVQYLQQELPLIQFKNPSWFF